MSDIAKKKRNESDKKVFFSEMMRWLKGHLASTEMKDREKVFLTSLILNWLFSADDYCAPSDAELGASCGRSKRTAERASNILAADGIVSKAKRMRHSFYEFVGLNDSKTLAERGKHKSPYGGGTKSPYGGGTKSPHAGDSIYLSTSPSTSPSTPPPPSAVQSREEEKGIQGERVLRAEKLLPKPGRFAGPVEWALYELQQDRIAAQRKGT